MPRLAVLAAIFAFPTALAGCPGSLDIWGVDVPIPGSGDDDDDDDAQRDYSNYDGAEYLNIVWTPEEIADGHFDCDAEWRAQGPNTVTDDGNLCPECDEIWTVTLVAQPGAATCLQQGTGIEAPNSYQRKVGVRLGEGVAFDVFRTAFGVNRPLGESPNDPLASAGVGAFQGAEYTWSGVDFPVANNQRGYSFYFSGEGNF